MIGRLGRSLGVHLLLASQRLEEGRLRGLDTHLSYRIGLRTFSADGEPGRARRARRLRAAAARPGHGYLKVDTQTMLRFRAAYVSGPYRRPAAPGGSPAIVPAGRSCRTARPPCPSSEQPVEAAEPAAGAGPRPAGRPRCWTSSSSGCAATAPPAHQVWLPPLAEPPTLDELLPAAGRRRAARPAPRRLGRRAAGCTVPVGIVDRPVRAAPRPAAGWTCRGRPATSVIVGRPAARQEHAAAHADLRAGADPHPARGAVLLPRLRWWRAAPRWPGCRTSAGCAGRLDAEPVRRTVAEVDRAAGAAGGPLRRARASTRSPPTGAARAAGDGRRRPVRRRVPGRRRLGHVARRTTRSSKPAITDLAARGLGFGIHVVVTATRWAEIRVGHPRPVRHPAGAAPRRPVRVRDRPQAAANVPEGTPGRGLTREKLHFLAALPRIDGRHGVDDLAEATADLVDAGRRRLAGPAAPRRCGCCRASCRPTALTGRSRPGPGASRSASTRPPGAGASSTSTADPHFIVFGDAECGKTNLLRLIAAGIVATAHAATRRG